MAIALLREFCIFTKCQQKSAYIEYIDGIIKLNTEMVHIKCPMLFRLLEGMMELSMRSVHKHIDDLLIKILFKDCCSVLFFRFYNKNDLYSSFHTT